MLLVDDGLPAWAATPSSSVVTFYLIRFCGRVVCTLHVANDALPFSPPPAVVADAGCATQMQLVRCPGVRPSTGLFVLMGLCIITACGIAQCGACKRLDVV